MSSVVRDFVRTSDPAAARRADEELVRAFATLAVRWNEAAERAFAIDPIRAHAAELYRAAELAESERDPKRSVALLGALRHLVQIGQAPPGLPDRVAAALRKVRRGDARARLLHAELLVARSAEHAPEVARLAETIRRTVVKDRFLRGAALHALGSIAIESGASSAAKLLDEARSVYAGWSSEEALVLTHRAIVEQRHGRIPSAIALLREASAIARRFGSARAIATVASVLGALLAEHGSSAEASAVLNEAITVAGETGDRRTEAYAQVCRGASLLARADASGAAECFRRAVTLFRDVGAPTYEAFARQELGIALAELGERTAARTELERALVELRASGYEAAVLGEAHLALLDWEEGAPDVARARLDRLRASASAAGGFAAVVAIARAFLDGRLEESATTTDERVLQRRAGALLRRSGRIAIRIAEDGSTFSAGSTAVALNAKPALRGVLAALARARGSIVAPDELVARAWPGEKARPAAALNRLYVAIRRLRALGLEGAIENVPGGYRLVATAQIVPVSTK